MIMIKIIFSTDKKIWQLRPAIDKSSFTRLGFYCLKFDHFTAPRFAQKFLDLTSPQQLCLQFIIHVFLEIGMDSSSCTHAGEKPFKCKFCEKVLYSSLQEFYQLYTTNNSTSSFFFLKEFLWKKDLVKHVMVHTGEKTFECQHCGQVRL